MNFDERKVYAAELLALLRFMHFRQDFLLDVVKKEGEMAYTDDVFFFLDFFS